MVVFITLVVTFIPNVLCWVHVLQWLVMCNFFVHLQNLKLMHSMHGIGLRPAMDTNRLMMNDFSSLEVVALFFLPG